MIDISSSRRKEVLFALRRGTVPSENLDLLAVGLERFEPLFSGELEGISEGKGSGGFKALRGDYGSGKSFFSRYWAERARKNGFVSSEVQISENETPLHKLQTVYRRLVENLSTEDTQYGALRNIIDTWFFTLEEEVHDAKGEDISDEELLIATTHIMDVRLEKVTKVAPAFSACLRAYRRALADDDKELADGLISWISGAPNVAATVKRKANIKGEIDHDGALGFLSGLLVIIRDSGSRGLLLVLDEVETLQRVRGDIRNKSLNGLRQLIDEIDANRFPGLYLLITGTPSFYDGNNGVQRLAPLAQRLHVDFNTDAKFDNINAVQIRLSGFDFDKLMEVAIRVREIYLTESKSPDRIITLADDSYLETLAKALLGSLGEEVGIAPRLFLKKLVADVLDRIEQHEDFNPRLHYQLTVSDSEKDPTDIVLTQHDNDINSINIDV